MGWLLHQSIKSINESVSQSIKQIWVGSCTSWMWDHVSVKTRGPVLELQNSLMKDFWVCRKNGEYRKK
jgi:hypothetical protein